jgi:hypothetical protein
VYLREKESLTLSKYAFHLIKNYFVSIQATKTPPFIPRILK